MGRIVITNATVLTLDDQDSFYYPGYVEIIDDRICKLGQWAEDDALDEYDGETEFIDGKDKLGFNDDLPLWEYLDEVWYPAVRAMTPETTKLAALYSYTQAVKSGTTTVNDMYRHVPSLAAAAEQIGLRAVLSNDVALPEHRLDTIEDNISAFHQVDGAAGGRVKVWMGIEWLPLADMGLLRQVAAAKRELKTGLHMHLCESRSEIADCARRYGGRSPVQAAHEAGLLGPDTVAAHCVHLTDADVALLARTGTHVSVNSGSNAKLGSGVARLEPLAAAGVNCGLGVDACECHNSFDLFEEMKITSYVQRALHEDPALGKPGQVLRMATRNGARALGVDAGTLEAGRKADVVLLDLRKDMMFTPLLKAPLDARRRQLESHLVFGCNGTAVETVIVDGNVIVRNRKVLGVDENQIRERMDAVFEDVVADIERKKMIRSK
ncbi:n-ethylammeline chlorohydrolase [Truncatella angustata]|uniref:N-ethylammeline chlorohydrolase n=1 Tax=Truncatella angustata TaxID=152316 RepID=A0A9P8UU22_9PEZI|nr:n-ethylammeline chlorohydrolase [Truncatella angustata]KAH6658512.1 n-ethylammeline chlorohydrolase [Truncatella angustata]